MPLPRPLLLLLPPLLLLLRRRLPPLLRRVHLPANGGAQAAGGAQVKVTCSSTPGCALPPPAVQGLHHILPSKRDAVGGP